MRALYRLADPARPPPHALHVERAPSIVGRVQAAIAADARGKHVVCGPPGVGKSSELHEVARALAPAATVIDVDLDGSGLAVAELAVIDLVYVIGVRALACVAADERAALHEALASACAGGNSGRLGGADDAIAGVAGFGDALTAVEGAAATAEAVRAVAEVRRRLIVPGGAVASASPHGRRVQAVMELLLDAVRAARGERPVVVMIDGLDALAAHADEHGGRAVRELLGGSRLVRDLPVAVIATVTGPAAHAPAGWSAHAVAAFGEVERPALAVALLKRITAAGVDADDAVAITERLAAEADGHPQRAVALLRDAALYALASGRARLAIADVDASER